MPEPSANAATPTLIDTDALKNEAAYAVLKWTLDGQHERDIIEALTANHGQNQQQAKATLNAVMDYLATLSHADTDTVRGFCFAAYREIYRRAMSIGDFANAIRTLKELDRLAK